MVLTVIEIYLGCSEKNFILAVTLCEIRAIIVSAFTMNVSIIHQPKRNINVLTMRITFQALDYTGRNKISLHNALLLLKEFHGESFSMSTWQRFLSSREFPDSDVYFDEIRFWLCSPPIGTSCSDKDFKEEENRILSDQSNYHMEEYHELLEALVSNKQINVLFNNLNCHGIQQTDINR